MNGCRAKNLYAKFRKAVEKAGGVLESRNWPINPDAVRPQQTTYIAKRKTRQMRKAA